MMKKIILASIVFLFLFAFVTDAATPKSPADFNGLNNPEKSKGKSEMQHLYLYEKCPENDPCPWFDDSMWGMAWGKMTFDSEKFVFNGHMVEPETEYELINYIDSWPGIGSKSLGTAMSDMYGDVHIKGMLEEGISGKIWLVTDDDFTNQMVGWNPSEYLFEYDLINQP